MCALASEIIQLGLHPLPDWIGPETRFLVIADVPVPAAMRVPTRLRIHKPDQRLFLSEDLASVRRWIMAPLREKKFEGVIDAYLLGARLTVFMGDLTIREFPLDQLPSLRDRDPERLGGFEIDPDGSFLYWQQWDVHLGPSQLLQAVDPAQLADVEIERHRKENTAAALRHMREERGLRQTDVTELSARQVSRLETGRSRLTADSAKKLAAAFDMNLPRFLDELGTLLAYWEHAVQVDGEVRLRNDRTAAVL